MRLSTFVLPVYAVSAFALVIPPTDPAKDAIAGPIAPANTTEDVNTALAALDAEYDKLEALKQELFDLHHKVMKQEHDILALINADYAQCSGFKCYFQTAIQKAPDYLTLVKTHFQHPKNSTSSPCPPKEKPITTSAVDTDAPLDTTFDFIDSDGTLPPPPPPEPKEDDFHFGHPPHHPPPFDHGFDIDHPEHMPHPPTPFSRPEYEPDKPNTTPPADRLDGHRRPHHRPHFPAHMPHPAPRHRHYKLIFTAVGVAITILIFSILFKAVRIYLSNPRVQADRAARREECRTKREYRRAACQHRLRQCLSRFRRHRRSSETGDYEEKRAMLQQQRAESESHIASHIVGADIDSLRRAHEIVDRLMRAEEGRRPRSSSVDSSETPSSSRSIRSLQTTRTVTTLPPYAPPPPRYSTEISRDMEVVDGFRYTPTQSGATPSEMDAASSVSSFILNDEDLRTESSVVDCRSRMSMESRSICAASVYDEHDRSKNEKDLELAGDRYRAMFN